MRPVVLVVDDDEDHVTMLEVALEAAGYDVVAASSVGQAQSVLEARAIDVIVADLTLGDGSALDVVAGAGARRPRVAVVLSGLDAPDTVDRTLRAGFDAHLVKPTSIERLTGVIEERLRQRESGMRLARVAKRDTA